MNTPNKPRTFGNSTATKYLPGSSPKRRGHAKKSTDSMKNESRVDGTIQNGSYIFDDYQLSQLNDLNKRNKQYKNTLSRHELEIQDMKRQLSQLYKMVFGDKEAASKKEVDLSAPLEDLKREGNVTEDIKSLVDNFESDITEIHHA